MPNFRKLCGEKLYSYNPYGVVAICTIPYGVEHSHNDMTAEEHIEAGKALRFGKRNGSEKGIKNAL